MATSFTSIPVIHYSLSTSPATRAQFVADLQYALVRVGFFYLIKHPIADETLNNLTEQSRLFFELPLETKLEADMMGSKHFLGYVQPSHEQTAKKTDHRETFTACLITLQSRYLANLGVGTGWKGISRTRSGKSPCITI